MVAITPELAGDALIFTIGYALVAVAVTFYSLYLNWKQSKVMDTQRRQIELLEEIRDALKHHKAKR